MKRSRRLSRRSTSNCPVSCGQDGHDAAIQDALVVYRSHCRSRLTANGVPAASRNLRRLSDGIVVVPRSGHRSEMQTRPFAFSLTDVMPRSEEVPPESIRVHRWRGSRTERRFRPRAAGVGRQAAPRGRHTLGSQTTESREAVAGFRGRAGRRALRRVHGKGPRRLRDLVREWHEFVSERGEVFGQLGTSRPGRSATIQLLASRVGAGLRPLPDETAPP
jgi:hypothetical protein